MIANSSSLKNGDQTVAAALAKFGRVDILIYNSLPEDARQFNPQGGSSDYGMAYKGLYMVRDNPVCPAQRGSADGFNLYILGCQCRLAYLQKAKVRPLH